MVFKAIRLDKLNNRVSLDKREEKFKDWAPFTPTEEKMERREAVIKGG